MNKEIAKKYFSHFSDKNIDGIESVLSKDCVLIDWDVEIISSSLILKNNYKFFKEVSFLLVEIKSMHEIDNRVFCDILIKKIHAYRSREISD